ncbi:AMP-binding protein [Segniliparus rugosus]|nr:AMP-binding protein [Segniliparus rugosus]
MLTWLDSPSLDTGIYFASDDANPVWSFASYADLAGDALRTASLLRRHGLERNGVVSILLPEPRDFLPAFYGALAAGGTPSPMATPLTFRSFDQYKQHVADILHASEPALVLVDPALADLVRAAVAARELRAVVLEFHAGLADGEEAGPPGLLADFALLQFTSGSSGTPKGVQVSATNLTDNIAAIGARSEVTRDDTFVSWLPHYHDMGLIGVLLQMATFGVNLRLLKPVQFVRSPIAWLRSLGQDGATATVAPSFGYAYAARRVRPEDLEGFDFSRWRMAAIAAERTDPVGIRKFVELAEPHGFSPKAFQVAYGLAEATLGVSSTRIGKPIRMVQLEQSALRDDEPVVIAQESVLGAPVSEGNWLVSCGTGDKTIRPEIIDGNGDPLPELRHGQIRVHGSSVAHGYRAAPHAQTSTSFHDGVLDTGDTGFMLDGELYVIGRMGDSIKVRGVKLFAEDLDVKIGLSAGLRIGRHAAILGTVGSTDVVSVIVESPDSAWLPAVKSVLSSVTSENIGVAVFRGEAGAIERTSSGKPRRRVLWQRLLDGELPVELVHTNWGDVATGPHPWPTRERAASPA